MGEDSDRPLMVYCFSLVLAARGGDWRFFKSELRDLGFCVVRC